MTTEANRAQMIRSLGASEPETQELIAYGAPAYNWKELPELSFPWPDGTFVPVWEAYAQECARAGSISPLAQYLVQLQFPIAEGMSQNEDYRAATRRAASILGMAAATGLGFESPETCRVVIHPTPAGKVPILIAAKRKDFVALVRALTERNEPAPVPDSMGACMVSGYNNLHRIRLLRTTWERANPDADPGAWSEEFSRIIGKPELFRDQFIIVSEGPYSNTSAGDVGMSEESWRQASLQIRIEHECTHFFVRRAFPGTRFQKNMHEELAADYVGISAANGVFRADWFLRFIGLEDFPRYRPGGRLENYRGQPALSDGAFIILQRMIKRAVENLEHFDKARREASDQSGNWAPEVLALSSLSIEELAAPEGPSIMARRLAEFTASSNSHQDKTTTVEVIRPAAEEVL